MDCVSEAEKIACAVYSLGDVSWFEALAVLVLPVLLGAVTLVVAIASLRIARSSLNLSEAIVHTSEEAVKKKERLELANEIYRWIPLRWSGESTESVKTIVESKNGLARIVANLDHSGFEGASELGKILWRLEDVEFGKDVFRSAFMAGGMAGKTAEIVRNWLEQPSSVAVSSLTLDGTIAKIKQNAKKSSKRAHKALAKRAAAAAAAAPAVSLPILGAARPTE